MNPESSAQTFSTRATLLLRLNTSDAGKREIAWEEFRERYAPVIAGFARNLGARPQDVDDVIQDVLLGFFAHAPSFVYDPGKGRFRGYLKVCTFRALQKRMGQNARFKAIPLDRVPEEDAEVDHVWNDVWAAEHLNRALNAVRDNYSENKTFRAFEQYVLKGRGAEEVAAELGLAVNGVYKAKERITHAIQQRLQSLRNDEG